MTGWQKEQKFVESRYAIQSTQINREIDEMEKNWGEIRTDVTGYIGGETMIKR